jgi:hypothetical protein
MALSANVVLQDQTNQSNMLVRTDMEVTAAVTVYQGAIVARAVAGTVSLPNGTLPVLGIALNYATAGQDVRIGYNFACEFTLSGVTDADVQKTVYASADDTITLTPTAGPSPLGQIIKVTGTNRCLVFVTCAAAPVTFA